MKLRYSPNSIRDLDSIRQYISRDNPKGAWVVASFIRRSIRVLERFPYLGRVTNRQGVRCLTVINYPYLVLYRVDNEYVLILSVMHDAQDR